MGTVAEDQLESHRISTSCSNGSEDFDVSCSVEADSRGSGRNRDEFHDANSIFQSKEGKRSIEKKQGFESCGESSRTDEEVMSPLDGDDKCHTNLDMKVAITECVSPVGDTCGAGMVECHADDLLVRERRSSQDDANGVYSSEEENSARVLLLAFAVEQIEVLVPYAGVPEVDVGFKAREFLRNISDMNASSVATSDAETAADETMPNTGMKEGAVRRLHGDFLLVSVSASVARIPIPEIHTMWHPTDLAKPSPRSARLQ
ncbi:hypothetical protein HPB50_013432 [Hyalomma asiaticum]|uniref:Uncharacterized protein n=1 Tax=Hyalomma asiaticum TaxID=266040 RepID=A0ACB7SPZ2_HYAAI|nr:hypothetical protein HPB50_013432 [Hyalomma asiaticum]